MKSKKILGLGLVGTTLLAVGAIVGGNFIKSMPLTKGAATAKDYSITFSRDNAFDFSTSQYKSSTGVNSTDGTPFYAVASNNASQSFSSSYIADVEDNDWVMVFSDSDFGSSYKMQNVTSISITCTYAITFSFDTSSNGSSFTSASTMKATSDGSYYTSSSSAVSGARYVRISISGTVLAQSSIVSVTLNYNCDPNYSDTDGYEGTYLMESGTGDPTIVLDGNGNGTYKKRNTFYSYDVGLLFTYTLSESSITFTFVKYDDSSYTNFNNGYYLVTSNSSTSTNTGTISSSSIVVGLYYNASNTSQTSSTFIKQ